MSNRQWERCAKYKKCNKNFILTQGQNRDYLTTWGFQMFYKIATSNCMAHTIRAVWNYSMALWPTWCITTEHHLSPFFSFIEDTATHIKDTFAVIQSRFCWVCQDDSLLKPEENWKGLTSCIFTFSKGCMMVQPVVMVNILRAFVAKDEHHIWFIPDPMCDTILQGSCQMKVQNTCSMSIYRYILR